MRLLPLLLMFAIACDSPEPGEPCETSGDGFTRQDPCEHSCIDWAIDCDGSEVTPDVCSAGECDADDDCSDGFVCLQVGVVSECLPPDTCN